MIVNEKETKDMIRSFIDYYNKVEDTMGHGKDVISISHSVYRYATIDDTRYQMALSYGYDKDLNYNDRRTVFIIAMGDYVTTNIARIDVRSDILTHRISDIESAIDTIYDTIIKYIESVE